MKNIGLDNDNNLVINNGVLSIISGAEEYRQAVRSALLTFQGEWFLNPLLGVPYYQQIYDKFLERSALRSIFSSQIKSVQGTTGVGSITFELDTSNRELTVNFTVQSIYGQFSDTIDLSI